MSMYMRGGCMYVSMSMYMCMYTSTHVCLCANSVSTPTLESLNPLQHTRVLALQKAKDA